PRRSTPLRRSPAAPTGRGNGGVNGPAAGAAAVTHGTTRRTLSPAVAAAGRPAQTLAGIAGTTGADAGGIAHCPLCALVPRRGPRRYDLGAGCRLVESTEFRDNASQILAPAPGMVLQTGW